MGTAGGVTDHSGTTTQTVARLRHRVCALFLLPLRVPRAQLCAETARSCQGTRGGGLPRPWFPSVGAESAGDLQPDQGPIASAVLRLDKTQRDCVPPRPVSQFGPGSRLEGGESAGPAGLQTKAPSTHYRPRTGKQLPPPAQQPGGSSCTAHTGWRRVYAGLHLLVT